MLTVFKYYINEAQSAQIIQVPDGAEALKVGRDLDGNFCLWCLVNAGASFVNYQVHQIWTGQGIPFGVDKRHWVDTQNINGLIYHIFFSKIV